MSDRTKIEWADSTWNPVRGCTKVSAGCKNCYSERFAERWRGIKGHPFEQGFDVRLVPEALEIPRRWRKPRRIFVNSMSDLFHVGVPDKFISDVFSVIQEERRHTFQVLTKRPKRMMEWLRGENDCEAHERWPISYPERWPLPNLWLGVSVEDQRSAEERIQWLLDTPAAHRFLSIEPMLGPVDLTRIEMLKPRPPHGPGAWLNCLTGHIAGPDDVLDHRIDWVIVGGESGPCARPMNAQWACDVVRQCRAAGVKVFVKQLGTAWARAAGSETSKGQDPLEWPENLRVQEMPR